MSHFLIFKQNVVVLSVIIPSDFMLNVIELSAMAPISHTELLEAFVIYIYDYLFYFLM